MNKPSDYYDHDSDIAGDLSESSDSIEENVILEMVMHINMNEEGSMLDVESIELTLPQYSEGKSSGLVISRGQNEYMLEYLGCSAQEFQCVVVALLNTAFGPENIKHMQYLKATVKNADLSELYPGMDNGRLLEIISSQSKNGVGFFINYHWDRVLADFICRNRAVDKEWYVIDEYGVPRLVKQH